MSKTGQRQVQSFIAVPVPVTAVCLNRLRKENQALTPFYLGA